MGAARPRWRIVAVVAGAALAILPWLSGAAVAQSGAPEYVIKATYLYKFGPYVEWPEGAFASPDGPLNLCVVGVDPFGGLLDDAIGDQRINGHPMIVRRMARADRSSGCHIAFFARALTDEAGESLAALHGAPVLTVTDGAAPGRLAGIINFVVRDNRVRFEIDAAAATASGLVISSKLLSLAVATR